MNNTKSETYLHPSYLFVGTENTLPPFVEDFLRQKLCSSERNASCCCISCKQILARQHHSIVWISPEKDYSLDDIDVIFEKIKFSLDPENSLFFVLNNVHTFNDATANRLLKVLEEPPRGYHFLLMTTNQHALLTTILSRCVVQHIQSDQETNSHPLVAFFTQETQMHDPFIFEQALQKHKPTDSQSLPLMEMIINFYLQKIRSHTSSEQLLSNEKFMHFQTVISFLQESIKKPPQSGSSLLFWKMVFMLFPRN